MRNENKNNDFIQQFVSSVSPYSAILERITYVNNVCNVCTQIRCLRSDQSINNIAAYGAADTEQNTLFMYVMLSKMVSGRRGGDIKLIKNILICVMNEDLTGLERHEGN